jgi:cell division protein FtsI (penicillin-binding protein 3)
LLASNYFETEGGITNVVKKGTGSKLFSKDFSMAGKTGTAQVNYGKRDGSSLYYASSFVGYFQRINLNIPA